MTYKRIKWMILFIPTLTVGIWEYVRHQFLLSYISMDLGNWLTPLLVYLVSVTLLAQLFSMLEKIQSELQAERAQKVALEEREQLAKELHDGISQSLFLLSVKADRLEYTEDRAKFEQELYKIRKTVHEVNRYVRQAIANLKYVPTSEADSAPFVTLQEQVKQVAGEVLIPVDIRWEIPEEAFSPQEKVELLACIREAVVNIQKHARAGKGWIEAHGALEGWKVRIMDDGRGFRGNPFESQGSYGLSILKERAEAMGWRFRIRTEQERTTLELQKTGGGA